MDMQSMQRSARRVGSHDMDSDLGICNWMYIFCQVVLTYTITTAFAIGGCNGWGDRPYEEHEGHGNAKYVHVPQTLGNTQIRLHRTTHRGWSMGRRRGDRDRQMRRTLTSLSSWSTIPNPPSVELSSRVSAGTPGSLWRTAFAGLPGLPSVGVHLAMAFAPPQ